MAATCPTPDLAFMDGASVRWVTVRWRISAYLWLSFLSVQTRTAAPLQFLVCAIESRHVHPTR